MRPPPAFAPFKCIGDTAKLSTSLQRIRGFVAGTARPGLGPGRAGPESPAGAVIAGALADGPADGNYPASEDAAAGEGLAAAERCGAERHSCCRVLLRRRTPAASGREPRTPD